MDIEKIKDKWASLIDPKEIEFDLSKKGVKELMENFLTEQTKKLEEEISKVKDSPFWKFAYPLVKNPYYGAYSWSDSMYLQPLPSRTGTIFYLDLINEKKKKSEAQPKSMLAPDCIPCGGEGGKHKLGCPVNRKK